MRARRHVAPAGTDILRAAVWGRFFRDLAIIAVVAAIGIGLSSSWVNPGPILDADHAVPRVIELSESEAKKALAAAGFRPRVESEWPSPGVPRGAVAWQDPAPDMVLPPNTVVDRLQQLQHELGLTQLLYEVNFGRQIPYELQLQNLRLINERVIPQLT